MTGPGRVLVVDDEAMVHLLVRRGLQQRQFSVEAAKDGEEGWSQILAFRPHVVIVDWMMPVLDGPALVRRIKEHPETGEPHIIMMTSKDDIDDLVAGLDSGADDFLTKPVGLPELTARVSVGMRLVRNRLAKDSAARYDSLTGLRNRRMFDEEIARLVGISAPFAVAIFDVDGLKQVNDVLGHAAGDRLLAVVGQAIAAETRTADSGYRIGGDEFAVLLPGSPEHGAENVTLRIVANTTNTTTEFRRVAPAGLSVGWAAWPPGTDVEATIALADQRMYEDKRQRKRLVATV